MHPDLSTLLVLMARTDDDGRAALRYLLDILADQDVDEPPEVTEVRYHLRRHATEAVARLERGD
jgi:hypothetical protein